MPDRFCRLNATALSCASSPATCLQLGYRTYVPAKAELAPSPLRADADSATLESPSFKAVVDPQSGTVRSLTDKRSGREVVDAASPHGFGVFLYERFDNNQIWDYIHAYLKSPHWTIDFEKPGLPPAERLPTSQHRRTTSLSALSKAPSGSLR